MMKHIFGIGITLQLASTVMPAISAETQLPVKCQLSDLWIKK